MHWLSFVGNCKNLNFVPFAIAGFCEFGNGCRFSHLTEEKRRELEQQCELEEILLHTSVSLCLSLDLIGLATGYNVNAGTV